MQPSPAEPGVIPSCHIVTSLRSDSRR
jgi:hypothetical protein